MSSRPVNICHSLTPQSQLHSLWSYRIHQKCKILGILHLHSMFEPTSHVRLKKLVNQQIQTCRRPASLYFYLYIGTHSRSLDYCTFLSPIISLPNNFQSVIMKLSSFLPLITDCSCSELCMSCKSFRDWCGRRRLRLCDPEPDKRLLRKRPCQRLIFLWSSKCLINSVKWENNGREHRDEHPGPLQAGHARCRSSEDDRPRAPLNASELLFHISHASQWDSTLETCIIFGGNFMRKFYRPWGLFPVAYPQFPECSIGCGAWNTRLRYSSPNAACWLQAQ